MSAQRSRLIPTLLACSFALAPSTSSASKTTAAAPADEVTAAELYDQGRRAYRLGNFEEAVRMWEQAYAAADKPLLLYNISLAYKGKYGLTNDIADLRKAKAVLENFITLANTDPELDVDDAHERLTEIDAMIAKAESEREQDEAAPPSSETGLQTTGLRDTSDDPLRRGGLIAMSVGGALVLGGVIGGAFFGVRRSGFADDAERRRSTRDDACMGVTFPPDGEGDPLDFSESDGSDLDLSQIDCVNASLLLDTAQDNRRKATLGMGLSLGLGLGLGAAALVAGGILFARSKERGSSVARHELRLTPLGDLRSRAGRRLWGLSLQGRF